MTLKEVSKEFGLPYNNLKSRKWRLKNKSPYRQIDGVYSTDPRKTKIVMNPNFAIIYEKTDDTIIIGDILYNTSIHANTNPVDITDRVALQIRMAMEQIGMKPENIDTSRLDDGAKAMCGKALGLKEELDTERGVGHGK